ncbi:hypothetical protein [Peribacillus frigoritolerans]|uniref:hypothetical protein n=1 Tax=Peribacillus frigoritolerans TaxID=450367 RepID=UPI00381BFF87
MKNDKNNKINKKVIFQEGENVYTKTFQELIIRQLENTSDQNNQLAETYEEKL